MPSRALHNQDFLHFTENTDFLENLDLAILFASEHLMYVLNVCTPTLCLSTTADIMTTGVDSMIGPSSSPLLTSMAELCHHFGFSHVTWFGQ